MTLTVGDVPLGRTCHHCGLDAEETRWREYRCNKALLGIERCRKTAAQLVETQVVGNLQSRPVGVIEPGMIRRNLRGWSEQL